MKDLAECKAEGRAKPRHKEKTIEFWQREALFWQE
jgi:hypothetical protein